MGMTATEDVGVVLRVVRPKTELVSPPSHVSALLHLLEVAGRTCYKSEEAATATVGRAGKFVSGIVRRGHESVIEHGNVTMRVTCSRSCSHQLVRHRLAAYSQESQRYCDYYSATSESDQVAALQVICPPSIADLPLGDYGRNRLGQWCWQAVNKGGRPLGPPSSLLSSVLSAEPSQTLWQARVWLRTVMDAYHAYRRLRHYGVKAEDARSVLPNATKTEVVVTYNLRQWRHVIRERALNPRAQWEIRGVMAKALTILARLLPDVFSDLYLGEKEENQAKEVGG